MQFHLHKICFDRRSISHEPGHDHPSHQTQHQRHRSSSRDPFLRLSRGGDTANYPRSQSREPVAALSPGGGGGGQQSQQNRRSTSRDPPVVARNSHRQRSASREPSVLDPGYRRQRSSSRDPAAAAAGSGSTRRSSSREPSSQGPKPPLNPRFVISMFYI